MRMKQAAGVLLALSMVLTGCSNDPNVSNENRGRLAGGLAGAAVANQISDDSMAPVVGALIGGYIGGEAGRNKDKENQNKAASTLNSALAKASSSWTDKTGNTQYTMSVSQPYQNNGKQCRPFTIKTTKNGSANVKKGIACLSNGVWDVA